MTLQDSLLERLINRYRDAMVSATDRKLKQEYFSLMIQAINRRSPEQVRRMEREQGLITPYY